MLHILIRHSAQAGIQYINITIDYPHQGRGYLRHLHNRHWFHGRFRGPDPGALSGCGVNFFLDNCALSNYHLNSIADMKIHLEEYRGARK